MNSGDSETRLSKGIFMCWKGEDSLTERREDEDLLGLKSKIKII
jgi:hypothetical protein